MKQQGTRHAARNAFRLVYQSRSIRGNIATWTRPRLLLGSLIMNQSRPAPSPDSSPVPAKTQGASGPDRARRKLGDALTEPDGDTASSRPRRLVFLVEDDLEDYLEVHLSRLISRIGHGLLIIGRQVKTVCHGTIDLLAIDATGVIYIIELKLNEASPGVIAQVLAYRRGIKRLSRTEVIRLVADGRLHVDLVDVFQRHFGHALPETVNLSQVLMIIAASIHQRTAQTILELKEETGYSIETFSYAGQSDDFILTPCCRHDQDMEAMLAETRPPALRKALAVPAPYRAQIYKVLIDVDTRLFWQSHAPHFTWYIVTFRFVYEQYEQWVRTRGSEGPGLSLRSEGQISRQLVAIADESYAWTRVFLAPGSTMSTLATLTSPPSTRTRRDAKHRIVGYLRNSVRRGSEAK